MKPSKANIKVQQPGLYSSIQDLGRLGCAEWGVPVAGAMDHAAFNLANHLLRNEPDAACLEMTLSGGKFLFEAPTQIVLTGAIGEIKLNDKTVGLNELITIYQGDHLTITPFHHGCRMYLGIHGGFQTEKILGSRSWYTGLSSQTRLKKGDLLSYIPYEAYNSPPHAKVSPDESFFDIEELEVYPGPESDQLYNSNFETFFERKFTLSDQQNRMGIQLEEPFQNDLQDILTAPVYPGTVQLTPSGKLLILMRDAQVTGGYPRVLQLSESAISVLAQKKPGDKIKFIQAEEEEG